MQIRSINIGAIKWLAVLITLWVISAVFAFFQLFLEISLRGKELHWGAGILGQLMKWLLWMICLLPVIKLLFFKPYRHLSPAKKYLVLSLTGMSIISIYLVLFNFMLFKSEGVTLDSSLFFRNLQFLVSQEILQLVLFYTLVVIVSNYLIQNEISQVKTDVISAPEPENSSLKNDKADNSFLLNFPVKTGTTMDLVRVEDILWISADGYCIKIHTGDRTYVSRDSMYQIEKKLNPEQFVRIHRSFIINLKFAKKLIVKTKGLALVITDGTELDVSRRRVKVIRKLFRHG